MTKKGHQKFWQVKIEKLFLEKVELGKCITVSEKCSEIGRGNLKQGGVHHCLREGWTPL